ncbi:MAG: cutinase family protein [Mycobacterium sp.]|nr:cutinase family protein [Mycobacterium sp.]
MVCELPPSQAAGDPCPDVEVIFARGTGEPAGLGRVGQAFVDALEPRLGGRTVAAYAVDYPASFDFLMAAEGADNAAAEIAAMASRCRDTRLVLGGYSQGAALVDMLAGVPPLGDVVGDIGSAPYLATPFADKVTAAAVFGNPSARFGTPLSTTGLFEGRAIDLCNPGDPICSPTGETMSAHENYEFPPYLDEAVGFVARLLV